MPSKWSTGAGDHSGEDEVGDDVGVADDLVRQVEERDVGVDVIVAVADLPEDAVALFGEVGGVSLEQPLFDLRVLESSVVDGDDGGAVDVLVIIWAPLVAMGVTMFSQYISRFLAASASASTRSTRRG